MGFGRHGTGPLLRHIRRADQHGVDLYPPGKSRLVAVPCFYLPWRLIQLERRLAVARGAADSLLIVTVWALIILWAGS